ncbi:MAG: hypothetical protein AB2L14_37810 [Candidatus Xenobiia bacterium LiM19]
MDGIKNESSAWFPTQLNIPATGGGKASSAEHEQSDEVTIDGSGRQSEPLMKGIQFQKTAPGQDTQPFCGEMEEPHRGLLGKWLQNSIIGLFVGITLLGAAGCTKNVTPQPPTAEKPSAEQVIPADQGPKKFDVTSKEDFKKVGVEMLSQLCDVAHRYGGDFYSKTDQGPSKDPVTPEEAYKILEKGESFYFKGGAKADPVEIKDIRQFNTVYKEVLAEVAKSEVESQIKDLSAQLKNNEFGEKVLTQLANVAQKSGGNLYKQVDGKPSEAPASAIDAYKDLLSGKSIYFKGSAGSSPLEIKNLQHLGTIYQQVAKEAALQGITDIGLQWIDNAVQSSEKTQQILTHLSEISQRLGGNLYGATKDGPSEKPITAREAVESLTKGKPIYLKVSSVTKPIEIDNLNQLGTVYQEVTRDVTTNGINLGLEWLKKGIGNSSAAKDLLVHLADMNSKYGGSFYEISQDGSKKALEPLDAYERLASGKGFFVQTSTGSQATQIRETKDLMKVYMDALEKSSKGQGDKEVEKTGSLLQKLMEEQLQKFATPQGSPAGNAKAQ